MIRRRAARPASSSSRRGCCWPAIRGSEAGERAWKVLERVGMTDAAERKVAGYSKGMRQRVRLAQAIAHDPEVLVLDEPLNGLDPLVRAETIALFREFAAQGRHVILSSHVLQEVDVISDQRDSDRQRHDHRRRPHPRRARGNSRAPQPVRDPLPRCFAHRRAAVRAGPHNADPGAGRPPRVCW